MTIDLNELSTRELDSLIQKAKKRKTTLKKRKPVATVRAKLRAAAKAEGYTLDELFGTGKSAAAPRARKSATKGRKLGKVPPKYRNPANPAETWTGRGKQPRWMATLTKKGKKPEDFLIKA
jgi:DNA-binding protein H-NS